ncbi:MAG TPA: hydantoinase B/oxoprolinase family protein [Xanthobacteraceae bacterium]|nr:hydantoinase B/oxoprolinase family protein [Xanthobacteraceae bacterium]
MPASRAAAAVAPAKDAVPEPIFREILKGTFAAMVREMSVLIERTAMSPIIREKQDYAVGMFDAEGRMVLAQFLMQGPGMIDPILKRFPIETMQPGDVYCYNDPYLSDGAVGHVPDLVFCLPVFGHDRVCGFVALFGHFWDVGGLAAGGMSPHATEVFHEGVMIPPIRLAHAGEYVPDLYHVLMRNTRFPQFLDGDVRACVGACRLGVKRIEDLFKLYGVDRVLAGCQHLLDVSGASSRAVLTRLLPEGQWHGADSVDDDGFAGHPFKVDLMLTHQQGRISFDLTGTDDQARGPINFILHPGILTTVLLGRILQAYDDSMILNDGVMAAADEVKLRPGSLLSPKFPAGVALRALSRNSVANAILKALSDADPREIPAASANYGIVTFRAQDAAKGRLIYCFEGFGIGMGARPWADGIDSVYLIGQKNNPVEWLEAEYPLRVERYAIAPDSGGPGQMRGGVGIVRDIRALRDNVVLCTMMINAREAADGTAGGRAGGLGRIILNPGTPDERDLPTLADNIVLNRGDLIRIVSAGGGGWGDPFEREAERVAWDVRKGYVSAQSARRDYGVCLGEDLSVEVEATAQARKHSRQ